MVTMWTYGAGSNTGPSDPGALQDGLILLGCLAVQFLVVGLCVWTGSLRRRRAVDPGHGRRGAHRRLPCSRRNHVVDEIDSWLNQLWVEDVACRRRRAASESARLISQRIPVVTVQRLPHGPREPAVRLTFADGTTLALWSRSRLDERTFDALGAPAVLEFAPSPECGALKFETRTQDVFIRGDLLLTDAL